MKLAYACNCIYRADASNESIYSGIYFNFVKDLEERSCLHLAVVVVKENGCVTFACAECIAQIVDKTCCQSIPKTMIVFVTVFVLVILISGFCFLK